MAARGDRPDPGEQRRGWVTRAEVTWQCSDTGLTAMAVISA